MNRILLRMANAPLLYLMACLLVSIQSSLFLSFPLNWIQPDLLLALVIWVALKRGFIEGGVLTLLLGHLLELHSSSPQGTFMVSTMAVFLLVRLAAQIMILPNFQSWIRLTLVASIASKGVGLLVLVVLEKAGLQWKHTLIHLLPGAVTSAVAGTWIYRALDRLDHLTHKDLRREQRLSDDFRLLESEGV